MLIVPYDFNILIYVDCFIFQFVYPATVLSNYGQLQIHNTSGWYSVCDENFDDVDARVACRSLGYKDGKAQCCSALGTWLTNRPIGITNISCTGKEKQLKHCPMTSGQCVSQNYVTVACTEREADMMGKLYCTVIGRFTLCL